MGKYNFARTYDVAQDYENLVTAKVGTDDLESGFLVVAKNLAGAFNSKDRNVYEVEQPTGTEDGDYAIIMPEEYYEDEQGNRINIANPTAIVYRQDQRVRALRPIMNKKYFFSAGLVTTASTASAVVGNYLVPTADDYKWTAVASAGATDKLVLRIEETGVKDSWIGLEAPAGLRVRVVRSLGI